MIVLFTSCHGGDRNDEDVMGSTCRWCDRNEKSIKYIIRKHLKGSDDLGELDVDDGRKLL
jgi:hypothetical protein